MKLISMLFLFATPAFAHVAPGEYKGLDQDGKACGFVVHEEKFENNQPHPLNERIPVDGIYFEAMALTDLWNLGHPPVVDIVKGQARFNHDLFQLVLPTTNGADSLTLIKADEGSESHAPKALIFIRDNYRQSALSKKWTCTL